jgi:hypothetical protein
LRFADTAVLAVNFDGATGEKLQRQIGELGIVVEVPSQDPGPILGLTRPAVLPTTFIVNPQGDIINVLVGPQTMNGINQLLPR